MSGGADPVRELSRYLDRAWDPIGVYGPDDDWPPGEYDVYATHVLAMLQRGGTAAAVSAYLADQATGAMGVGPGPTRAVAEQLHRWWHDAGGAGPVDAPAS